MKKFAAAILLALAWIGSALAQTQFPATLPSNSVWGRTGIGAGPGQAIPFSVLFANMFGGSPTPPHSILVSEGTSPLNGIVCGTALALIGNGASVDPSCQVLTNAGLANMAAGTIKGNNTGVSGPVLDLTGLQAEGVLQFLQAGSGAVQRSLDSWVKATAVHASDFVAAGAANAQNTTVNVTITSGQATLAVGTATFAATDCQTGTGCTGTNGNKVITVGGIGASSAPLQTTIIGFTDSQHITLGANAGTSQAGTSEPIVWGTDNTTALQNWLTQCATSTSSCFLDAARYLISSTLSTSSSQVNIFGAGQFQSEIIQANVGVGALQFTPSIVGRGELHLFRLSQYMPQSANVPLIMLNSSANPPFTATLADLYLFGGNTGISALNIQFFNMDRLIMLAQSNQAVFYNYSAACNIGTMKLENSFVSTAAGASFGLNIQGEGAVTIQNNLIAQPVGSPAGTGIIFGGPSVSCSFGDIFIDGNNLEYWAVGASFSKGSATSGGAVHISGNDFANDPVSLNVGDANANWLNDVTLYGNHFYCTTACVSVTASVNNITITSNSFNVVSGTPTGINVSGSSVVGTAQSNTFQGMSPAISNSSPKFMAESTANGHGTWIGVAPTLTAGCNGTGSSVSGTDRSGTVTGSTAAATTCTLTFAQAYAAAPNCVASGLSSPLTGAITPGTSTLVVNFASTGNFKWTYFCPGN